jgi:uncharacterized protein YcnI
MIGSSGSAATAAAHISLKKSNAAAAALCVQVLGSECQRGALQLGSCLDHQALAQPQQLIL